MRHPMLLVIGHDQIVAESLRRDPACEAFAVHEPRRWETCRDLLASGRPAVVVIQVGGELVKEYTLLDRVHHCFPEIPCIVVGDHDHASLAGLAHDLGAKLALFPPLSRNLLGAAVAGFMRTGMPIEDTTGTEGPSSDAPTSAFE